ncbi:unnamed protein product [Meganyctiphanes norvegica]|uniref:Uncharacterized protein n=1 Tax=Meganyctiphanes norvegica TaxID=48144 RepID=A0AAV2QDU6_MEGNR
MFDATCSTPAFISWIFFLKNAPSIKIIQMWSSWINQLNSKDLNDYNMFINLFENVQIHSMSEAIAETVGSMTVSHGAKGCGLQPLNLNIDLCLRFNLWPLHLLENLIREIIHERKTNFIRKLEVTGILDKLVSAMTSSKIHNYRKKESNKARLPNYVW